MGKYRQGRKIFWATLALLLLIVAMPLSVAGVEYWNEHISGTESVAYNFDNSTAISGYFLDTTSAKVAAQIIDTSAKHDAALSPFWDVEHNNESGWNEVFVNTGASSTDNTSAKNILFFSMNVSAKDIINKNINKLSIRIDGLNPNTSAELYVKIANVHTFYADTSNAYSLDNGAVGYHAVAYPNIDNNGTLRYTLQIDPAIASYIAGKQDNTTWVTKIVLLSHDSAHDIISEGNTVYFKIQYLKPHGRLVIASYDATEFILAIWTGIGLMVLFVTSPAWNPTTHNGLIEHIIQHRRYSRASRSRSSRRSRRTHRTHRSSHRRRSTHRRRR